MRRWNTLRVESQKARAESRQARREFRRGRTVFRDPRMVSVYNGEHSDSEDRWATLGISALGAYWLSATPSGKRPVLRDHPDNLKPESHEHETRQYNRVTR